MDWTSFGFGLGIGVVSTAAFFIGALVRAARLDREAIADSSQDMK